MPEIKWEESVVIVPEGNDRQVCFSSNIGTARPYDVTVGVREKGSSPATSGKYHLFCSLVRLRSCKSTVCFR